MDRKMRKMVSGMNVGLMPNEWYNGQGLCLWDLFEGNPLSFPSFLCFNEPFPLPSMCLNVALDGRVSHISSESLCSKFFPSFHASFTVHSIRSQLTLIPLLLYSWSGDQGQSRRGGFLCCVRGKGKCRKKWYGMKVRETEREREDSEDWKTGWTRL